MESKHVYKAINAVAAALSKVGIEKGRQNREQNYAFRGIDQVYNTLAPILAANKLLILPRVLTREQSERQTRSGGVMFSVVMDVEFDFVSAEDGSSHTIKTYGEGMDTGDKATNKAMSAAYKYAAIMAFAIPVEGQEDADATTPEEIVHAPAPREKPPAPRSSSPRPVEAPAPAEAMSPALFAELHKLATAEGNAKRICAFFKVDDLTKMSKAQAEEAIATMKKRRAEKLAKEAQHNEAQEAHAEQEG